MAGEDLYQVNITSIIHSLHPQTSWSFLADICCSASVLDAWPGQVSQPGEAESLQQCQLLAAVSAAHGYPTHTNLLVCRRRSRRRTTSSPCSGTRTATQHLCVVQHSLLAPSLVLNAGIAASTPVVAAATQQAVSVLRVLCRRRPQSSRRCSVSMMCSATPKSEQSRQAGRQPPQAQCSSFHLHHH